MSLPTKRSKPELSFLNYSIFYYGPPKIGKSSLFKHADYFYLAYERGLKALAVFKRYPRDWDHTIELVDELEEYLQGGGDRYKGVVVDPAEKMAIQCMHHSCESLGIDHPQDAPYGKGWEAYRRELETFVARLAALPIPVAYISHSQVSSIFTKNKEKSRISPKLSGIPRHVILSQVDGIVYVGYSSDGENRILRLTGTELIEAGGRYHEVFDFPKTIKYRQIDGHNYGLEDLTACMKLKKGVKK